MKRIKILPLLLTLILALCLSVPAMALDEDHDPVSGPSTGYANNGSDNKVDKSAPTPPPIFLASQTTTIVRADGEKIQGFGTVNDPYVLEPDLEYVLTTSYSFGPRTPNDVETIAAEAGYDLILSLPATIYNTLGDWLKPTLSTSNSNITIASRGCRVIASGEQRLDLKLVADSHRVSLGKETDEFAADTDVKYSQSSLDVFVGVKSDMSEGAGGTISFHFTTSMRPRSNSTPTSTSPAPTVTRSPSSQDDRISNDAPSNPDHDDGQLYGQKDPTSYQTADNLGTTNPPIPESTHPTDPITDQPLGFWDGVTLALTAASCFISLTALGLVLKYHKPSEKDEESRNYDSRDDS